MHAIKIDLVAREIPKFLNIMLECPGALERSALKNEVIMLDASVDYSVQSNEDKTFILIFKLPSDTWSNRGYQFS